MSLESNIADLVSASTQLTQAVNITRAEVDSKQASAVQAAAAIVAVKDAVVTAAGKAATSASQAATSLSTTVSDYAAQKVTKGLAAIQTSAEQELADRLHRRDPARYPFRGAKPSLVLDFVRQECHRQNGGALEQVDLNSFMTFTRSSTATFTGPDGVLRTAAVNQPRYEYDPVTGECLGLLIEEQRTNLSNYSQALHRSAVFSNASYIADVAISPSGLLDAGVFLESPVTSYHYLDLGATLTVGVKYVFSIFVKAAGRSYANILFNNNRTFTAAGFNLITKTTTANTCGCTQSPSSGISDVGNGWLRLWAEITPVVDGYVSYRVTTSDATTWLTAGDATKGLYVWGAQLEAGAFPTSYIPTPATFTGRASTATYLDANGVLQTAASGVSRSNAYGYDADGVLRPVGLLLENSATNLISKSVPSGNYPAGGSTTASYTASSTVFNLPGISITGNDWVAVYVAFGAIAVSVGTVYTFSLFSNSPTPMEMLIDTVSGYKTSTVTYVGATTYRHAISIAAARTPAELHVRNANGHTITGFQLEAGNYATSYIPTTTAQVTRAADTATSAQVTRGAEIYTAETGTFYNHEEGVLFTSITNRVDNPNGGGVAYFYSSGVNPTHFNSFGISDRSNRVGVGNLGGALVFNSVAGNFVVNTLSKSAIAYNATRFVAARNNALSADAIAVKRFRKIDRISVGTSAYKFNIKECLNGCIRLVVYYPKSLSNTDLQALTIL